MEHEHEITHAEESNQLLAFTEVAEEEPKINLEHQNDIERHSHESHNLSQSILDNSVTYQEILN
jgi:hypothetical protein